jgi:hypothetical protein
MLSSDKGSQTPLCWPFPFHFSASVIGIFFLGVGILGNTPSGWQRWSSNSGQSCPAILLSFSSCATKARCLSRRGVCGSVATSNPAGSPIGEACKASFRLQITLATCSIGFFASFTITGSGLFLFFPLLFRFLFLFRYFTTLSVSPGSVLAIKFLDNVRAGQ